MMAIYVVRDALTGEYERAGVIYERVRSFGIDAGDTERLLRSLHGQQQAVRRWGERGWEYAAVIG